MADGAPRRSLLVFGRGGVTSVPLPEHGRITVGRGEECDVRVADTSVSRRHLAVIVGDSVEVVDLGSALGTRIGDRALAPDVPVAFSGIVSLGATTLVVREEHDASPRRVHGRAAFDARLGAAGDAASFVVLDVVASASSAIATRESVQAAMAEAEARERELEATLAESLRPDDVLASIDGERYALLLVGASAARGEAVASQLRRRLVERRLDARVEVRTARTEKTAGVPVEAAREVLGDAALARVVPTLERIARGTINVLVLGETGVGKEVVARTLHAKSPRAAAPLVSLNCAAFSEQLLESELFGHERGAFTGALAAKPGLLESAEGGTVFLDEIGDMPAGLQAKLLRVLEQREVQRVGALRPRPIDVRFVAATNRDLEAESAAGRFRADLYFRLAGATLSIPPLRERVDELEALARAFVANACAQAARPALDVGEDALAVLRGYGWPGNIRELRNVMERAVLLCEGGVVRVEHLQLPRARPKETEAAPAPAPDLLAEPDERKRIALALARSRGNQTEAAALLGISRRTLVSRLTQYELPRPRKKK